MTTGNQHFHSSILLINIYQSITGFFELSMILCNIEKDSKLFLLVKLNYVFKEVSF